MKIIVEIADGANVGDLTIPNNADLLFREASVVNEESLNILRQAMTAIVPVVVQIEEGPIELQVNSTIVQGAILDALVRRLRNGVVENETLRFVGA
jgi:hypothetical protein